MKGFGGFGVGEMVMLKKTAILRVFFRDLRCLDFILVFLLFCQVFCFFF